MVCSISSFQLTDKDSNVSLLQCNRTSQRAMDCVRLILSVDMLLHSILCGISPGCVLILYR